ncbi:hypothetical protein [Ralstonia solanacearum]|uniref:hypothetical protein n=1 Tax=Ralstonia solanacearum TaxID=305 RepID=UPI00168BC960|nr:hypothetical protein [Ralstonia solanacearum]QNT25404.1 hypothetical protein C2I38_25435 [Ralstonia solanacearum]QNT63048.1 hypothetical protein C2L97_25460 [Ralstonia solanacearum]
MRRSTDGGGQRSLAVSPQNHRRSRLGHRHRVGDDAGVDTDYAEVGKNTLGDLLQRHWAKLPCQKKGRDSERHRIARFFGS